jgi:hypothetical protein
METLWLTLGIACGLALTDKRSVTPRKLLAPLATFVGVLGLAVTVVVVLRFPSQACDFGTPYEPCSAFGKWGLAAILLVPTIACLFSGWFIAWNEARAQSTDA